MPVALSTRYWACWRAHGDAVEGHVVVDRVGVADQAVVGDDLDASLPGCFSGGGGGGAVLRADDQDFDALGDQGFDVGFFLGGITLAEQDFDIVAGRVQGFLEARSRPGSSAARLWSAARYQPCQSPAAAGGAAAAAQRSRPVKSVAW